MSKRTDRERPRKPPRYRPLDQNHADDGETWLIKAGFAPYMYRTVRHEDDRRE